MYNPINLIRRYHLKYLKLLIPPGTWGKHRQITGERKITSIQASNNTAAFKNLYSNLKKKKKVTKHTKILDTMNESTQKNKRQQD